MSQSPSPSAPESSPSAAPGSAPAPGDKQPDSYDVLPYLSRCFAQTHPDNLAVAARLRGLQPAPIDRCRVLELGCAGGGNLLPLAATWPGSTFVGIDRSVVQVQQGNELVAQAGLKNIELRIADLMEFEGEPGSFDYILCHGVYSWVPEAVQARIFALCQRLLAPHGIDLQALEARTAGPGNQTITLKQPVPIYVTYLTAFVNKDGTVNFRDDIYGRDAPLLASLEGG